jgi:choline dehydrogenase-like flavoprotein
VGSVLAERGHAVTLVELGQFPAPLLPDNETWTEAKVKAPFTRGSGVGGTTNFWHGGLTVLDRSDVEGIPDSGRCTHAPIAYDRLREYYAQAIAILRRGARFTLDDIEAPPEAPPDGFENLGRAFRLKALLYPDRPFSTRHLVEHARQLHGMQVVTNVEVKRLVSSGNRRFTHAEGVDLGSGALRRYSADLFVLSAGGLGSPKILLQSTPGHPSLGRLPIGGSMIDHPTGFVFKAKLRQRRDLRSLFGLSHEGFKLRYGFALNADRLARADFRNHILYLRPAISMKDPGTYDFLKQRLVAHKGGTLRPVDIVRLLWHSDLLFDAINFKYGLSFSTRCVSGLVFAEQLPDENARLSPVGDGRFAVKWRVSDADRASLGRFLDAFFEDFADLFEAVRVFPDLGARLDSAGHHSGACRMARDATEGVVDADLRVFGADNLHVVDGSVLARSGHANTGLSIAALALKCCDAISAA